MKAYEASAAIAAPPDIVWAVLTDAGAFGDWDSGAKVEGRIAQGERLKVTSEANPKRAFPVRVTELAAPATAPCASSRTRCPSAGRPCRATCGC